MIVQDLFEAPQLCPECGGVSFSDLILAEKKDACYYKVKASAKVWPSAYASGRLVQCRKKGADNYGNSKNEGVAEAERQPGRFSGAWQILVNGKKVHSFRGNFDQETADRVGVVKAASRGLYNPDSGDKIKIVPVMLNQKQGVAEGYQLDEGAVETITALAKKIPGIGKYYQMAQQYKPQLIEILKTSKSSKEVKQKMEQLAAGQSATVAESGMTKQLGGLAVGSGSILSTMWMNAMGMIDGVLAHAAAGEVGGAVASGSILGLIPVTLMLFAAMLLFKGSKQSSDEKAQAFQAQRGQQGVAEGSGPKEKQKTPYRDINSAEYRAAAEKQKQQMAKDKAAEPGKKLLAKKGVAEAAKWRQGYRASGHPPGYQHKSGEIGPLGGTYDTTSNYGDEVKVPVNRYRDEPDRLADREKTKLSTSGKPLTAKNAGRNLKTAIRQAKGKHGPVGVLPEQGVAEGNELTEEFDLIESIIDRLAEHNGVDAELIWEDLESLTDDELYVFAVTTPLMEDWQKANKQDRTDGMSRKAVNAYRRENPGSKLKTAVTTKPSKLKRGSKASKRRKSYCSRSRGQMKMHSISCAKTPDKAICKARRRWNCESVDLGQGVAEGEVTRTPKGLIHRATDRYGAGEEPFNPHNPGKYVRDLDSVDKKQVKDLDASMGINWRSQGPKGIEVDEQGMAQDSNEKIGGRYDPDEFDSMVQRLKKLAGAGPMKTVYDQQKRVYRNVPVAQQPDKK